MSEFEYIRKMRFFQYSNSHESQMLIRIGHSSITILSSEEANESEQFDNDASYPTKKKEEEARVTAAIRRQAFLCHL